MLVNFNGIRYACHATDGHFAAEYFNIQLQYQYGGGANLSNQGRIGINKNRTLTYLPYAVYLEKYTFTF